MKKKLAFLSLFIFSLLFNGNVTQANIRADMILVNKSSHILTLYHDGTPVKQYQISLGKSPTGNKLFEGDNRTPEGNYYIAAKNPNSQYHMALKVSYPSKDDVERAHKFGKSPGGDIMVHGLPNDASWMQKWSFRYKDWTAGCIAVSNNDIEEIYSMVNEGTPIIIRP